MKNKTFLVLFSSLFILFGCTQSVDEEIATVDFNMNFIELDKEQKTAKFQVTGYPNEEEFAQIETVIKDSLKEENLEGTYKILVYSDKDDVTTNEPFYGTLTYEAGEIEDNNLNEKTETEYLEQ